MKTTLKAILIVFGFSCIFLGSAEAQVGSGFGIKGSLNYNSNGRYFKDAQAIWGNPWDNLGYNLGVFGKLDLGPVYLRPELGYTNIQSEINNTKVTTQRLDAPVLVGLNLLGSMVSVFGGPTFHYYMQDGLRDFDYNKYNAGYQFGVGLNFGSLGLDLRYERVMEGQSVLIDDVFTGNGDFVFQQLLLGLSLKF
ncbi:outer membrane beta-barrel protein [Mongoliibacter ruber]|uniref:Outer membrane protein with beta-barrel domain n=1 Tax=Mongoliibacter ruber TaxID=1750599 RepID=A0A2T0WK60_9BACT|nr:outer membrane beta-barrel protein [Mongoliibacter ruber]PRY87042.1 outer membrane protein with beta-barrel domain [Mongoliibacter ruber]